MDTSLNGIGAARTASRVRKEIASRKDGMIYIWRALLNGGWVEDQLSNLISLGIILYLRPGAI